MQNAKLCKRPQPPELLIEEYTGIDLFFPSPELNEWARAAFLDEQSPLFNPDHSHLLEAEIGYLWTNVPNVKGMRVIAATAEIFFPRGNRWQKARQTAQIREWFGDVPDFLITFDARLAAEADDIEFCARTDHELYHCAQKLDEYGAPVFNALTERPIFCLRGHDVEEFIGVVRRFGPAGAGGREMVAAANGRPEIATADISLMCGNCLG